CELLVALLVIEEDFELLLEVAQRAGLGCIRQAAQRAVLGRLRDEVHPEALFRALALIRAGERDRLAEDLVVAVEVFLEDLDLVGAALIRLQTDEHRDEAVGAIEGRTETDGLDLAFDLGESESR